MSVDESLRPRVAPLSVPPRLMLGPGPSNADPRILLAMGLPEVGHMDPVFIGIMEEVKRLLRYAWQTKNEFTIPVSGCGSAAMEATICNLLEEGDSILVFANGYFGHRMKDMAERYGARVIFVEREWGTVFTLEEISAALREHRPTMMGIVHAETSTGACQPLEGVADVCRETGTLLLADTVTSLSGVPLFLDQWGVDAAYSGSQKCLACPPGIAPLSFSARAMQKLNSRKSPVKNWYLDMSMIAKYIFAPSGAPRSYHHTAPISMMYALREALRFVAEEGLETRWARHRQNAQLLWSGLRELGLELVVDEKYRLPSLTTVYVPDGVDAKKVCTYLLDTYNIELGGGLGVFAGKVWRIGLMGYNSREDNVRIFLGALKDALSKCRL